MGGKQSQIYLNVFRAFLPWSSSLNLNAFRVYRAGPRNHLYLNAYKVYMIVASYFNLNAFRAIVGGT